MVKNEDELRGPCPIHKGSPRSKTFTVNLAKKAFKCFSDDCHASGNVLDFVAAMERCSVREAELKLHEWFKVGESDDSQTEHEKHCSGAIDAHDSMRDVVAEIQEHCAQIAYHASELQAKTTAVKEIVS
jgi:DNA primase